MITNRTNRDVGPNIAVVDSILTTALATSGTLALSYPTGKDRGNFAYSPFVEAVTSTGDVYQWPKDFTVAWNAADFTITWRNASTLPAGTRVKWQISEHGTPVRDPRTGTLTGAVGSSVYFINLGSPATIDADGICASQSRTGAGALTIDGALASGGKCTLDVPRNVVVDSGGADTAVITVTGTDVYGQTMSEAITLNGATAVSGVKAFKTITAVSASATISNGFFMGPGDVLGLPVFLPATGLVLKQLENGAAPTDGTLVAGSLVAPTTTSADVRGTYDPNSACNGSLQFALVVALPDPGFIGGPQA